MKKIIFVILAIGVLFLTSCKKDEIGGTATEKLYSGEWVVATTCDEYDDDDTTIEDGKKLMIANSAANVEDEIVIVTSISYDLNSSPAPFPVRGKFKLNGSPSSFKGTVEQNNLAANMVLNPRHYAVLYNGRMYLLSAIGEPDEAGEEWDGIHLYTRMTLDEGKITPNGAKTIGGYTQDAISMKVTMYHDLVVIESYETPKSTWDDENVPEFDWRIKEGSRTNAEGDEEHWTLEGYRYTGFDNDEGHH